MVREKLAIYEGMEIDKGQYYVLPLYQQAVYHREKNEGGLALMYSKEVKA